jgi:hypothetical protein
VIGYRLEHLRGGEKSLVNGHEHKTPTLKELVDKHDKWVKEEIKKAEILRSKANECYINVVKEVLEVESYSGKGKECHMEYANLFFKKADNFDIEADKIEANAKATYKIISDMVKIG